MFKKKIPEAVVTKEGFYVSLNAVRNLIKKIKKEFIEHREKDFNEYLQEVLDDGVEVNVRRAKKLFKLNVREFEELFDMIDRVLKSSEEHTKTEDNRVK